MTKYVIFDLDNCLSDDGWRIPRIDWKADGESRWSVYHALSPFDNADNQHVYFAETVDAQRTPIFSTGRPALYYHSTIEWLRRNFELHRSPILLMRPDGYRLTSPDLKIWHVQILTQSHGINISDIEAAYDDRQDIVDRWLEIGIVGAKTLRIHGQDGHQNGG